MITTAWAPHAANNVELILKKEKWRAYKVPRKGSSAQRFIRVDLNSTAFGLI
jgi:hypothetical protein